MNSENALIYLSACAVNSRKPDPALLADTDMDRLFELAVFHQMAGLADYALEDAGIYDQRFLTERAKAVYLESLYDREREALLSRLEEEKIRYLPMKGCLLKEEYPAPGMRQMSDNDILIDASRAEDVRAVMEELGFETNHFGGGHRDDYRKKPVLHFEIHRTLFEADFPGPVFSRYYQDIETRMIPDSEDSQGRHLSEEDFYIYMICHEYKHIAWGGIGLRALLDVYVYLKKYALTLDWEYIGRETEKLGIRSYERKNRRLAGKVFSKGDVSTLTKDEQDMLTYFVVSGVHGTMDHSIQNEARSMGVKRYVFSRIFLPLPLVKENYPFFYKYKILLPVLPLYRLVRNAKNAKAEGKALFKK